MTPLPTLYIAHGGGPCFFMEWPTGRDPWGKMAQWLRALAGTLPYRPQALVIASGHWEEPSFSVTSGTRPALIYDYYGFPEHTYRLRYDAPGDPELARETCALLSQAGIACRQDPGRGFDHGVFIPFKLIFPEADVPIVQLSLKAGLDPATHLAAGAALQSLRARGVLLVGSGMSFHNLSAFGGAFQSVSDRFDAWLTAAVCADAASRNAQLAAWQSAPYARYAHPREEHLAPLFVAAGAAGTDPGRRIFSDSVLGTTVSAYQFDAQPSGGG